MSDKPRDAMAFPRFFNPEELGCSLKEVATDLVATKHKDIVSRWFHSAKDADLFIWSDSQRNIIKQQLSFYGQVVEWNVVEGVKTGLIIETETQTAMNSSDVVRFDAKPQRGPVDQAVALLRHIAALRDDERDALTGNFRQIGNSTTMSPEMFVERFGRFLERLDGAPDAPKANWFQRLISAFRRR